MRDCDIENEINNQVNNLLNLKKGFNIINRLLNDHMYESWYNLNYNEIDFSFKDRLGNASYCITLSFIKNIFRISVLNFKTEENEIYYIQKNLKKEFVNILKKWKILTKDEKIIQDIIL